MNKQLNNVWQEKNDSSKKIIIDRYNALDGIRIKEYINIPSDKDKCVYMSYNYLISNYVLSAK